MEVTPIGIIHTPFALPEGTPIQPTMARGAEGEVELAEEFADALKDVDGFDRIWLIYWFHRGSGWKPTVTPYMDDRPHGLFATRAPRRPNAIGMSCVRVLAVSGNRVRVADVDMLDGTPLIDIKPYVPRFDAYPEARSGWLDDSPMAKRDDVNADDRFHAGNEEDR